MNHSSVLDIATVVDVLRFARRDLPNGRMMLRCPLPGHEDTNPSFRVVGERQTGWRCFGCGRRGGVLDLIMALGHAQSRAGAASWLEAHLRMRGTNR